MTNSPEKKLLITLVATSLYLPLPAQIISDLSDGEGLPHYNADGIVSSTDTMTVESSEQFLDWNYTLGAFSDVKTITTEQLQDKINKQHLLKQEKNLLGNGIPSAVDENGIDLYMLTEEGIEFYLSLLYPNKEIKVTNDIVKWIRFYAYERRKHSERAFERFKQWEPYINTAFAYKGVPKEIAPLCIVESACNTKALSKAGAYGMWQIMPATGTSWGLKITPTLDEREDPIKATQTAAKILSHSHKLVNDWILCIAGYNCGMQRIQNTIKRYGTTDWLELKPHLSKETQQYIPSYIAVRYVWIYRKKLGF